MLQVIDWGLWAQFYQRQLCLLTLKAEAHRRAMLGWRDDAARFRAEATDGLGALQLFGTVSQRWALAAREATAGGDSCDKVAALSRSAPELLSFSNWEYMARMCAKERDTGAIARPRDWFAGGIPSGTAYDVENRLLHADEWPGGLVPSAETLRQTAPFDRSVLDHFVEERYRVPPTQPELEAAYGHLGDYDVGALYAIAAGAEGDIDAYRGYLERIASLAPNAWLQLGSYLAERDMDDAAAGSYQKALAEAPNRVAVSQQMDWYVDYLFDRGETDRALEVAREVADVYSGGGLSTMARLMERMGRCAEAEEWYRKVEERYANRVPLLSFYLRRERRGGDGRFAEGASEAMRDLFPSGLESVAVGSFTQEPDPSEGVSISALNLTEKLRRLGLRAGDRVVAVDGFRVRNRHQYLAVQSLSDDASMKVVVWRRGSYEEVTGIFRRYKYGPVTR